MDFPEIAYISRSSIPSRSANSIHIMNMCNALSQRSKKLYLITDPKIGQKVGIYENGVKDEFSYYGLKKTFEIIKIKYIWINKLTGIFFSLLSFLWVKKNNIKIVYTRDLLSAYLCSSFNYHVIYESHGISESKFDIYITKKIIASGKLNLFVFISNELRKLYRKKFSNIAKIKNIVAHDAVNLKSMESPLPKDFVRNKFKMNKEAMVIAYAGSLRSGRGIDLIISISDKLKDFQFFIAGGTEQEIARYREIVRKKNIKNIKYVGYIPNGELVKYLSAFDILLMPYAKNLLSSGGKKINNTRWMSPMKMFEYMASGVPIISSKFKVLEEVLINDFSVAYVDNMEPENWIAAIKKVGNDSNIRSTLGQNARLEVKKYTWEKRADKILSIIKF